MTRNERVEDTVKKWTKGEVYPLELVLLDHEIDTLENIIHHYRCKTDILEEVAFLIKMRKEITQK